MSEEPQFVVGRRNVASFNKHWRYCQRTEIPCISVQRSRLYSDIHWDMWTIDVAYLGLKQEARERLDSYILGLLASRRCKSVFLGNEAGSFKVKKELEDEALRFVWGVIGNRSNWTTKEDEKI